MAVGGTITLSAGRIVKQSLQQCCRTACQQQNEYRHFGSTMSPALTMAPSKDKILFPIAPQNKCTATEHFLRLWDLTPTNLQLSEGMPNLVCTVCKAIAHSMNPWYKVWGQWPAMWRYAKAKLAKTGFWGFHTVTAILWYRHKFMFWLTCLHHISGMLGNGPKPYTIVLQ